MADLFWPGDERAAHAFDPGHFLETMGRVEDAWFRALELVGIAPETVGVVVHELVGPSDLAEIAGHAEASGNPVVPLVALMRERLAARDPRPRAGCTAG